MDLFIVTLDSLIIILYIVLMTIISQYVIQFLKKKHYNLFIQLLPVSIIILVTSLAISIIGYGGFKETFFFQLTSILSFLLLLALLFLTLLMKKRWPEQYEKLLSTLHSFWKKIFHKQ